MNYLNGRFEGSMNLSTYYFDKNSMQINTRLSPKITKDVLAIQICTIVPEFVLCISDRILNSFKSLLNANMVGEVICLKIGLHSNKATYSDSSISRSTTHHNRNQFACTHLSLLISIPAFSTFVCINL